MNIIRKAIAAIGGLFNNFIQRNAGIVKMTTVAAVSRPTLVTEVPASMPLQRLGRMSRVEQVVREGPKVGRNEPCTCGSGQKFKKCHGA